MKVDKSSNEKFEELIQDILEKDKQEQIATGHMASEILSKLNISIDALPQKCQELLYKTASNQVSTHIDQLDPIPLAVQHAQHISTKLTDEYEILKLEQKNAKLQVEIDRNNRFLEDMRKELECSRESLMSTTPNPENIQDHIKQMKQKVISYEESYKKATMKFSKLSVPESVLPKSLSAQMDALRLLREEAAAWEQRADDVLFTRDARNTISRLRR